MLEVSGKSQKVNKLKSGCPRMSLLFRSDALVSVNRTEKIEVVLNATKACRQAAQASCDMPTLSLTLLSLSLPQTQ